MNEARINKTVLSKIDGCPFWGPIYQLLRQYILAAFLLKPIEIDEITLTSIGFKGNTSLNRLPTYMKVLGGTVIDAWNNALKGVPKMRHIFVDTLVSELRKNKS